jgi:hypothetical protein
MSASKFLAVLLAALHVPHVSFAEDQSLMSAWGQLKSSWLGAEIKVACEGSNFKISKTVSGRFEVYWLTGESNWLKLELKKVADEAITFRGLGKDPKGVVGDFEALNSDWTFALQKHVNLIRENEAKKVDVKIKQANNNNHIPFEYELKFLNEEMISRNVDVTPVTFAAVPAGTDQFGQLYELTYKSGELRFVDLCSLRK